MKSKVLHIVSLLMLPMLLLSGFSWTRYTHLCRATGEAIEADCCEQAGPIQVSECHFPNDANPVSGLERESCCYDHVSTVRSQVSTYLASDVKAPVDNAVKTSLLNVSQLLGPIWNHSGLPHKLPSPPPKSYSSLAIFIACFRC